MVLEHDCLLNSWTLLTTCTCTNYDFKDCKCRRVPSTFTLFVFIILPIICIGMICLARQCMKYSFCPLHSIEKDYKKWIKKQKAKNAEIEARIEKEEGINPNLSKTESENDGDIDDENDGGNLSTKNGYIDSAKSMTSSTTSRRKKRKKLRK